MNPWHSFSRSHGIALNWVWHNILRPGSPRAFGFIDDDLFPTAPDDPFAPLDTQDFFGLVRQEGQKWFLWAGYCTFRFDAVKDKPLDFGQDWFIGLDTGGANWSVLYQHVDRGIFGSRKPSSSPIKKVSTSLTDRCNGAVRGYTRSARWETNSSQPTNDGSWPKSYPRI